MAVCDSIGTNVQDEYHKLQDLPALTLSKLTPQTTVTDDSNHLRSNVSQTHDSHATNAPKPIKWDRPLTLTPLTYLDKPDLSQSRHCSTSSSTFSDIQLFGQASLGLADDIEYVESRALSIPMAQDITAAHTQDSYDSPSDSDCDTPTAHTHDISLEIDLISQQKTQRICHHSDSDITCVSESVFDYSDQLPDTTPEFIAPPLPLCLNDTRNVSVDICNLETKEEMDTTLSGYEHICVQILEKYKWQKPINNPQNYSSFYPNFQKEIMNNPFFDLTPADFNDVLKKCQFIRSRWIGEKIRSSRVGKLGKSQWNIGEKITELDLFAIKLYTDFEACQRELKKCYRPPLDQNSSDIHEYEQRLCYFSHWRRLLDIAILKYGTLLKNRVFYHGINKIMELDMHPTHRCHGPFSATSDLEIARGFATKHGFIMQLTSKYPRLGTDYFFDAAPISAYPDEKEYLIGFMYTRILNVCLGCTKLEVSDLCCMETMQKLTCFIMRSLMKNNLYSYGPYLEILFHALLKRDQTFRYDTMNNDYCERIMNDISDIAQLIPQMIIDVFRLKRKEIRVLKLDVISDKMRCLFMKEFSNVLCMRKIMNYAPMIRELHLYENKYEINDEFIGSFMHFVQLYEYKCHLETIKCFKYSFEGSSRQFQFKRGISKANEMKLETMGWRIYEYYDLNCYKFILTKKKRNK